MIEQIAYPFGGMPEKPSVNHWILIPGIIIVLVIAAVYYYKKKKVVEDRSFATGD